MKCSGAWAYSTTHACVVTGSYWACSDTHPCVVTGRAGCAVSIMLGSVAVELYNMCVYTPSLVQGKTISTGQSPVSKGQWNSSCILRVPNRNSGLTRCLHPVCYYSMPILASNITMSHTKVPYPGMSYFCCNGRRAGGPGKPGAMYSTSRQPWWFKLCGVAGLCVQMLQCSTEQPFICKLTGEVWFAGRGSDRARQPSSRFAAQLE